jgi:ribosomal protein S27E
MIIKLTCHTPNCENAEIPIPFEDPADMCICGVCGQEIIDKVE